MMALSSVNPNSFEDVEPARLLDPSLEDRVPDIPVKESTDTAITSTRAVVLKGIENKLNRSSSSSIDQTNLEWQTFDGSLPNGAVSIHNGYVERTDYVCKYGYEAGFYNPDKGPYCHYTDGVTGLLGSPFEILVNKDNFEFLEWKDGSYGSVPQNSVKTVSNKEIYVGKNKYGLGKVDVKQQCFYYPWDGTYSWSRSYQVLTFNKEICSEHISDVKYKIDGIKPIEYPPETMDKATFVNNGCQALKQTASLSKMTQVEQRWDTTFSFTLGSSTTISAGIPLIGSAAIEISASATFQFTKGTTHTESKNYTVSVEHEIPPNHSCGVTMVGHKYGADIPYTARVCRTYRNGETKWTSISGTYRSVQVTEVQAVVDHCEPLSDASHCN